MKSVKSSGFLGGQAKTPTVIHPDLYKLRFTEAMSRYFLLVPDWSDAGPSSVPSFTKISKPKTFFRDIIYN